MIQKISTYFERQSFGVCTYLGERFNVSIFRIRLLFIYASFLSIGVPLIIYFVGVILLDMRRIFKSRNKVWE